MATPMKLRTKEPEWIRMSIAARQIDENWSHKDLSRYMVDNGYITEDQFFQNTRIPNVIQRRLDILITDYSWDLFEISDGFINHVIEERKSNKL